MEAILQENAPAIASLEDYSNAQKMMEVDEYFNAPKVKATEDPLKYWMRKATKFPTLARLARRYLSIPASSVYSERLFSEFGNVYDRRRSRLKPDTAKRIVFLHHNLPRFNNAGRKPMLAEKNVPEEDNELAMEELKLEEDEYDD